MRHFSICCLLLVLLFPLILVSVTYAEGTRHQAVGTFEIQRNNGTPVLQVKFSDKVTGRFLLDTGSYECLMTDSFAKKLGYKPEARSQRSELEFLYDFFYYAPSYFSATSVTIGELRVRELQFRVVAKDGISPPGIVPIDGTLGGTLLSKFALLLDYPRHTVVWIQPGNLDDGTVASLGFDPKAGMGLHQEVGRSMGVKINQYSMPVKLRQAGRQQTEEMFLDTGSPLSSLSAEAAKKLDLRAKGSQPYQLIFQAPDVASKGVVPEFQIGSQTLANVAVIFPKHRDAPIVSLLGANVLGNGAALFDFGPHRFYFKPLLPGITAAALPPLSSGKVDWNRLRNAPDTLDLLALLSVGLKPEATEGLPAHVARLRGAMVGDISDAERYCDLGSLLEEAGDTPGAQAAWAQSIKLCRDDCLLHPNDLEREARRVSVLTAMGRSEEAISAAQKSVDAAASSARAWRTLGEAQEAAAFRLLAGKNTKIVAESQGSSIFPYLVAVPEKPDTVVLKQIEALRHTARESYIRFVSLAPNEPQSYGYRAQFWSLDYSLLSLLHLVEVKRTSLSESAALAGVISDYQRQVQSNLDDIPTLRTVALLAIEFPGAHDRTWLHERLHGTGQSLSKGVWITADSAQMRLTALSLSKDHAVAVSALEALGDVQQARDDPASEESWNRASALDPARTQRLCALAEKLAAEGRFTDLRQLLTTQLARTDISPLRLILAATDLALEQPEDAEVQVRAALKSAPQNPVANLTLATLLVARSGYDYAVLSEAAACLDKARIGFGLHASAEQKSSLQTVEAVLLALTKDPTQARQQLMDLAQEQPTCTQAREALAALTLPAP